MNNYDDIFDNTSPQEQSFQPDAPFDKDAWAEKKQAERASAYELIDRTAEAVAQDGSMFKTYLNVQSRLGRYSVGNALLIAAQRPDAKRVGDFDYWKEQGGNIKRYEKGFTILEPGDEYTRDDGSIGVSHNPKKVFDIAQTTVRGKMQPQINRDERLLIKALVSNAPVKIQSIDDLGVDNKGALFDPEQNTIFVRKGMEGADIFRSISSELALVEYANDNPNFDRNEHAFHAYCVSYVLCERNGIDTKGYDFSHLPDSLSVMDAQEIRSELSAIRDAANEISSRMGKVLEQGKPTRQQEHER